MILFKLCVFRRYESGVRDGEKRISSGVDECDEAGAGDEVDRGGGYGWVVGDDPWEEVVMAEAAQAEAGWTVEGSFQ